MALLTKYTSQEILNACFDETNNGLKISGGTISGDVIITGNLTVLQNFNFGDATTDILTVNGALRLADGTAGAPSLSFINETNLGIFRTSQSINFSVGVTRAQIDATGLRVANVYALGATFLVVRGTAASNGSAVGVKITNSVTLSTAGDKIAGFYPDNGTTSKAYIDYQGTLQNSGGRIMNVTTVNASTYDILTSDYIINVTRTSTGTCAIDLKTAQTIAGRVLYIKDAGGNSNINNITITTEGAQTIDGQATKVINTSYSSVSLYCDGSNWFVF